MTEQRPDDAGDAADDAARDALALVRLFLEVDPGDSPDPVAYRTIVQNGQLASIAEAGARIFAAMLIGLEKRGVIDSAEDYLQQLQIIWASDPDA